MPPKPPAPFWYPQDLSHLCAYCRRPLVTCGYKRIDDGADADDLQPKRGVFRAVYAQCNCEGARQ